MAEQSDVLVCGLGATGSATLFELARAGVNVLGIDRFVPPHTRGSSHGESRIIRQAYHEHPHYVPFVQRAWERWEALQRETTEKILAPVGGIMLGDPETGVVRGTRQSAAQHGLPVTEFDHSALNAAFPAFRFGPRTVGIFEKKAGILFPEASIRTFLGKAGEYGARIHTEETVQVIDRSGAKILVRTDRNTYSTNRLVISAGAWMKQLLPELTLPLLAERQILYWFGDASGAPYDWRALPIYIWEYAPGKLFYGFPDLGGGVKVARHHQGEPANPDGYDTQVHGEEVEAMKTIVAEHFRMNPEFLRAETCLYTNTPDEHFILDHYPGDDRIVVASPCSGHGFKFASYTGELLARLAMGKDPGTDLGFFSLKRFGGRPAM